ncbi:hypothetical protein Tco_1416664 [Tanacetum coccineum]
MAEVDSVVRSSAPVITTVTTVTATVDAATAAKEAPTKPSLFGTSSPQLAGLTPLREAFRMFLVVISLLVVSAPLLILTLISKRFKFRNGALLIDLVLMTIAAEVRMRAEYNIKEKRKLRSVVDEQTELLRVKDKEIENLKAQLLLKEAEAAEAIRLHAEVSKFKNDILVDQVDGLEISSAGLQEKVTAYESCIDQLEKFQDDKMKEVNHKFDQLYTDFIEMALHLEEKFYPHLLTIVFGRQWLLTHGMELAIVKCLNSTLEAAIGKAVEKGMQDGLSTGITHGAEGRNLTDVAVYNPSAEADYISALQRLQSVNFSLIAELRSNKDASFETIMNLLHLDDTLAKKLGLTESQPHANQLMVPIHRSPDQTVFGATALSLSLDVSHARVQKIRENIINHRSALRDIFIPLAEPLSSVALEGTSCIAPATTTTLSVTFASVSSIPPILTDDYEVVHADGLEGVGADANPFPNVDDVELNIQ